MQALDLADGLVSMGCSKGDRILSLLVEDKVSCLLFLAAAAIGAIFCQVKSKLYCYINLLDLSNLHVINSTLQPLSLCFYSPMLILLMNSI